MVSDSFLLSDFCCVTKHLVIVFPNTPAAATQLTVSKVIAYVELVYNTRQKRLENEAQRLALQEKGQTLVELTPLEKVSSTLTVFC